MPAASAYPAVKAALVTRLRARAALAHVNVLDYVPVNPQDLRTAAGEQEAIYVAGADGPIDDVVMCAGALRFDETPTVTVTVEVVGADSGDTQAAVDSRCNELLYEVLADVAAQRDWDLAALGLDVFDYCIFTPNAARWSQGRVEGTAAAFAARCDVGVEVRARRSFT